MKRLYYKCVTAAQAGVWRTESPAFAGMTGYVIAARLELELYAIKFIQSRIRDGFRFKEIA